MSTPLDIVSKLKWNLPWLARYPFVRFKSLMESTRFDEKHIIITVANHFEPAWSQQGPLEHRDQIRRLREYRLKAVETARTVSDDDGRGFSHTNFYPAEQYHPEIQIGRAHV